MGGIVPIERAFYCTASRDKAPFNCLRQENPTAAKIAPFINQEFYVTSEFGDPRPGRDPHKGLDIPTPSALGRSKSLFNV